MEMEDRKLKRMASIPGIERAKTVTTLMGLKGNPKAGESSKLELETKTEPNPLFKNVKKEEAAPIDVERGGFSFSQLAKVAKESVKSGDAEKMANVPLKPDQKRKVLSTLKSETKTVKAVEASKEPAKASVSDNFTSALMQFLPLAAGSLIGGLDVGVAAQEGANKAVADQQAAAMDKEKLGIERFKEEADAKFKEDSIALQKQKLSQESYLARLEMAQKIQDAGIKSSDDAMKRFVGSQKFGNLTALTEGEAPKLREEVANTDNIINKLDGLYNMTEGITGLDRERRAIAEQDINTLIGDLRLALTGPGPLTDTERDFVKDIIGNPTKMFSLESVERVRLKNLAQTLDSKMRTKLRSTTVEGAAQLKAETELKRRGYSQEQINKALGL